MDVLGIVGIPAIMILSFVAGMVFKAWKVFDDRKIPVAVMIVGIALGAVVFYCVPALTIANDIITALAIGAVSGMGATCVHQIYKQATKDKEGE